ANLRGFRSNFFVLSRFLLFVRVWMARGTRLWLSGGSHLCLSLSLSLGKNITCVLEQHSGDRGTDNSHIGLCRRHVLGINGNRREKDFHRYVVCGYMPQDLQLCIISSDRRVNESPLRISAFQFFKCFMRTLHFYN